MPATPSLRCGGSRPRIAGILGIMEVVHKIAVVFGDPLGLHWHGRFKIMT